MAICNQTSVSFSVWHSPPAVDEPQMFGVFTPACFKIQVKPSLFNILFVVVAGRFVMPANSIAIYNKYNGR